MAAFCAFFSWCDPDTFWNLELDEYVALAEAMSEIVEANRGS